ncbi:hypothetical protein [Bradyrhizobium sp. ORS 111]|uniref:hypothetical protein n=1 Tax=Bradyrhizobium sp. ORS 111 TaxID=1685958 RepID=UPI00388DF7D0
MSEITRIGVEKVLRPFASVLKVAWVVLCAISMIGWSVALLCIAMQLARWLFA